MTRFKLTKDIKRVIIGALIIAFTILIVQGIIGFLGLDTLSNVSKIIIGVVMVIVISFIANKLKLTVK